MADKNLPLLPFTPIVDPSGSPTVQLQQYWQQFIQAILENIDNVQSAIDQAVAAQTDADLAQDQALAATQASLDAIAQAVDAQTAAAAAQSTANGKLDQTAADARYVRQDQTTAWTTPTGAFSRAGFVSYASPGAAVAYDQTQIDALMTAVQSGQRALAALVSDLKANNVLT